MWQVVCSGNKRHMHSGCAARGYWGSYCEDTAPESRQAMPQLTHDELSTRHAIKAVNACVNSETVHVWPMHADTSKL